MVHYSIPAKNNLYEPNLPCNVTFTDPKYFMNDFRYLETINPEWDLSEWQAFMNKYPKKVIIYLILEDGVPAYIGKSHIHQLKITENIIYARYSCRKSGLAVSVMKGLCHYDNKHCENSIIDKVFIHNKLHFALNLEFKVVDIVDDAKYEKFYIPLFSIHCNLYNKTYNARCYSNAFKNLYNSELNKEPQISKQGGFKLYFPINGIKYMALKNVEIFYLITPEYGLILIKDDHESAQSIRKMIHYHDSDPKGSKLMLKVKFYNDNDVVKSEDNKNLGLGEFIQKYHTKGDKYIVDIVFHLSFKSEKLGKESIAYK
eukprot:Pgem_evm1s19464